MNTETALAELNKDVFENAFALYDYNEQAIIDFCEKELAGWENG